jgi:hypothetical protein
MGCDIHMIGQYKALDGSWSNFVIPEQFTRRHYDFFGVLAGVRNEFIPRISEPKGLPKDFSSNGYPLLTELFDAESPDCHSTSYITVNELRTFIKKNHKKLDSELIKHLMHLHNLMWDFRALDSTDAVRIVFNFDS